MSTLFIIWVGLTVTLFSEKLVISTRCITVLMPNLIKKSVTVSKQTSLNILWRLISIGISESQDKSVLVWLQPFKPPPIPVPLWKVLLNQYNDLKLPEKDLARLQKLCRILPKMEEHHTNVWSNSRLLLAQSLFSVSFRWFQSGKYYKYIK